MLLIYIKFVKNNIFFYLKDKSKTLTHFSLGSPNKKMSLSPIHQTTQRLVKALRSYKFAKVALVFLGYNKNKGNFMKSFFDQQIPVTKIFHVSQKPFNGCKKRKKRRL